jgi:hypothetical protein
MFRSGAYPAHLRKTAEKKAKNPKVGTFEATPPPNGLEFSKK